MTKRMTNKKKARKETGWGLLKNGKNKTWELYAEEKQLTWTETRFHEYT